jgi:hypothetical protein
MPGTTRQPGKRGRLPVKPPAERFPIRWIHEYTGPLSAPSYPVDVSGGITDWGMAGNGPDPTCTTHPDGAGDCGFAGREHNKMAKAAAYGKTETWESSDALVAEYLAYDHGQDNGVVLADALLAWYDSGKIVAFAPVDHSSTAAMDSAMAAFHGLYTGVSLTGDADQLFSEGLPWTTLNYEQPDPSLGHCIVKVKADGHRLDTYVTWGALQEATTGWTAACIDEAWVIITSEDEMDPAALAALRADIDALHGHGGAPVPAPPDPVPVPVPPVPPGPVPVTDPADLEFVTNGHLLRWAFENHGMAGNRAAAMAARTWLAKKGYAASP